MTRHGQQALPLGGEWRADAAGAGRPFLVVLLALALLGAVGFPTPVDAQPNTPTAFWGYLRATEPATKSYTPGADHQHSSTGTPMTVSRSQAGEYIVYLPLDVRTPANAQISAFGNTFASCYLKSWEAGNPARTQVWVKCVNAVGAPVDSKFSIFISSGVSVQPSAYLMALEPALAVQNPDQGGQFNITGGANVVNRQAVGTYVVDLPGLGPNAKGSALLSVFNDEGAFTGASNTCIADTAIVSGALLKLPVKCYDAKGKPVDAYFSLTYFTADGKATGTTGAYVWVDGTTNGFSMSGQQPTVGEVSTGYYAIEMPGLGKGDRWGNAQVTGINKDKPVWCALDWVGAENGSGKVWVRCVDAANQPVSPTTFSLMYLVD